MVLVFALAAALCLRAFVLSDRISRTCEERDRAVLAVQTTAEALKHYHGDYAKAEKAAQAALDNVDVVFYHSDHIEERDGSGADLFITILPTPSDCENLRRAEISARGKDGQTILTLSVAWQEVIENG